MKKKTFILAALAGLLGAVTLFVASTSFAKGGVSCGGSCKTTDQCNQGTCVSGKCKC